MNLISRVSKRLRFRAEAMRSAAAVRFAFRHVHGPRTVALGATGVGVVGLMKDAEWFIKGFLDHHLGLGVAHVVIVDNGSTDRTVEIAASYERVTVLRNEMPARHYESRMRTQAAKRVFRGGWTLFADADEQIDVPFAGPQPFAQLIPYLDGIGANAVVGQMLDLYDAQGARETYPEATAGATTYALSDVDDVPYHEKARVEFHYFLASNKLLDPGLTLKMGGLRREVFGEVPFLSKHLLVKNVPEIEMQTHAHCASKVTIADVTLLIRHYKLAGDWRARDAVSVAKGLWGHGEDVRRLVGHAEIVARNPLEWRGVDALVEEGFLFVSPSARQALCRSTC